MNPDYATYLYETHGPSAVYEAAESTPVQWDHCIPCDASTPRCDDDHTCLLCGQG